MTFSSFWSHVGHGLAVAGTDVAKEALPVAEVVGPTAAEALIPGEPGHAIGAIIGGLVSAAENKFPSQVIATGSSPASPGIVSMTQQTGPTKKAWVLDTINTAWPLVEGLFAARGVHVQLTTVQMDTLIEDFVALLNAGKKAYADIEAAIAASKQTAPAKVA